MADIDQDFNSFVQDAIRTEMKNVQGSGTPPQPEPLEFKVGGQDLKFGSRQELEAALNQFVSQQATQTQQLQSKIAEFEKQQSNPEQFVSGGEAPSWSDEAFIEKMTKAPREAMEYTFNQLFFNGQSQDPVAELKTKFEDMELTKRSIAAYQFREQHPEFAGGQQVADMIDKIRGQMNLPYDVNGLEAAYLMGINKGIIPNFYNQPQQQTQQGPQLVQQQNPYSQAPPGYDQFQASGQQNPYLAPPPSVNRNSPTAWQPNFNPDDLSTDQIEAIFQKAGKPIQRQNW